MPPWLPRCAFSDGHQDNDAIGLFGSSLCTSDVAMKSGTRIFAFVALPKNIITMLGTMTLGGESFSLSYHQISTRGLVMSFFSLKLLLNGCC